MSTEVVALGICGLYLLISLALGLIPGLRVSASVAGYVAGDRAMNVLVLYFVLGASIFSSFAFLGGPGWAYSRGAAAFYIIAYGTVGIVPLYFFGPRTRRMGERFGFVTQAEMLAHRFATPSLSPALALLSIAAFIPYLTLQMKGSGYILATVSGGLVPEWLGAAIPYAVVLVYVLASGVMGVGWTNTFQGLMMMIIAWFLGLYLPWKLYGGVGAMFEAILARPDLADLLSAPGRAGDGSAWNWWAYSSAVVVSAIGFSMWPHFFMKSFAAASDRTMRLTVVLYPTFQIFLVPILLIGFAGVIAFPGVEPDTILPYLLTQIEISPILIGLVSAGTLAASMSSGDAILHAAASVGVRDGLKGLIERRQPGRMDDRGERLAIRLMVVVIAGISYYFAVVSEVSIVALLLGSYGGIAQIFPLVFAAFYWPRATGRGALAGLLGGIAVSTLFLIFPELRPVPLHEGIFGLVVNVALLVGVSLATEPQAEERVRPYVEG